MVGKRLLLSLTFGLLAGCGIHPESKQRMNLQDMLAAVRNDRIQFATTRPPDSLFATLERRVVVTGPPELIDLTRTGDLRVLDKLVNLLEEPDRAWAAMVLLAALTRREEKIVDAFAARPAEWSETVGKTAFERWGKWLDQSKGKLVWDPENHVFIETN